MALISNSPADLRGVRDATAGGSTSRSDASVIFRGVVAFALANALWLIWSSRFPPLQDYPDWVYQGWLLSRIISGHAMSGYTLAHYPVPNTSVTLALGLLDLAIAPQISGKILLTLIVGLFVFGSIYLLKLLNRSERNPLLLVPLVLVFNFSLLFGGLACALGLGGLFLYAGYLFRRMSAPATINPLIVLIASCALFLTHIADYGAAGVVTAAILITQPDRLMLRRMALPWLPSGGLLIWSTLGQKLTGGLAAHAVWKFWSAHQLAGAMVAAFPVFTGFLPWVGFDSPLVPVAAAINLLWCVGIVIACLVAAAAVFRKQGSVSHAVSLATALSVIAVVAGGYAYGIFISPGGRFLLPAAWLALCWLGSSRLATQGGRMRRALSIVLIAVIFAQAAWLDHSFSVVGAHLEVEYQKFRSAPTRAAFCAEYRDVMTRSWPSHPQPLRQWFFPAYAPIVRLPYYLYIERADSAPINPVGFLIKRPNGDFNDVCGRGGIAGGRP
ncbi:MAG TPA: hypothetical protein VMV15_04930 [Candidatus Binataceae bacterium]|nr:hypothetical protein [Candidatus Binataceae bacterium]